MEDKLYKRLGLPEGAHVLDAGCGVAHVALYMARRGLRVTAIDVIDHHVEKARRNIDEAGLPDGQVSVRKADYHHLEFFADESFDGIYTMETLVHATDLDQVLRGFFRMLKPGGALVGHEYEIVNLRRPEDAGLLASDIRSVSAKGAMPLQLMLEGNLKAKLEEIGFVDVEIEDYSKNIRPMLRLFLWMAFIPFCIFKLLRVEKHFVNTMAGAGGLLGQRHWRYISVRAIKPGGLFESDLDEPK